MKLHPLKLNTMSCLNYSLFWDTLYKQYRISLLRSHGRQILAPLTLRGILEQGGGGGLKETVTYLFICKMV